MGNVIQYSTVGLVTLLPKFFVILYAIMCRVCLCRRFGNRMFSSPILSTKIRHAESGGPRKKNYRPQAKKWVGGLSGFLHKKSFCVNFSHYNSGAL